MANGYTSESWKQTGVLPLDVLVIAGHTEPEEDQGLHLRRKLDWRLSLAGAAFLHAFLLIILLVASSLLSLQQPSLPEVMLVSLSTVSELEPDAPSVQPASLHAAPSRPAPVARRPQNKTSARSVATSPSAPAAAEVAEKSDHPGTEETAAAPATVSRDGGRDDHASEVPTSKVGEGKTLVQAQPRFHENRPPTYPELARRRQLEGTVVLEAVVGGGGKVDDLAVYTSSGHQLLDEAALQAVRGWFFEPGRRGGMPITMKILVPVRFALR